jgi:hypothetical protein
MEFRAVCKLSNIHATSTECAALRAKFKRVFVGTGTKREVTPFEPKVMDIRIAPSEGGPDQGPRTLDAVSTR